MTAVTPEAQQQSSSVSAGFISNMLNPNSDTDRVKALEYDFSEFKQTNLFTETISSIPGIVDAHLANKMNEDVKTDVQLQSDILRDESQAKNEDFINKLDENIKKVIKEQVKVQVKEKTSHAVAANLSELELKKILIDKIENIVTIKRRQDDEDDNEEPSVRSNRGSKRRRARKEPESTSEPKEKTSKSSDKSTKGSKSHHKSTGKSTQADEPIHNVDDLEELAPQEFDIDDSRDSFNVLMDTPLDFLAFVMNQLKVDTLTLKLLAGPTFKLMQGSCKSLVELEYFLEEVYKETTDQLDCNNAEGRQYPHDLRKSLPLIPNSQGRRVIPFDHFINNDLAYLRGGASSRTYAMSVTKTKAVDYGHIKWIEDLVPSTMWSPVSINYDKHTLWGISHWGRKRQQFYGYAANRKSARDVYSEHNHCHYKALDNRMA
nr:hypothetical protein [Tanacetum cinerariifolium]